jgi:ankyrin repeat protein
LADLVEAAKVGDVAGIRQIVGEKPELLNQGDERFGATALHWAALTDQVGAVRTLVELGADVNVTNRDGETPAQVAARAGRTEAVRALSGPEAPPVAAAEPEPVAAPAAAAEPSVADLVEAAKVGDVAGLRRIVRAKPELINRGDERFGATALHWAALADQIAAVEALIELGADVNVANRDGETPLQVAERGGRAEAVRVLSGAGRAPAATTAGPSLADLVEAAKVGDVAGIRRIVGENPYLLNRADERFGATPLHWAAVANQVDAVRTLVELGADVDRPNRDGETPLQVAERGGNEDAAAVLRAAAGGW